MLMMMSQILKSVDFTKTRKSESLENEISFFYFIAKSCFLAKVTLKAVKKRISDMKVYYIKLSVHWTSREFQNQTILFSRKIKFPYNIILKLLSLFHLFLVK